MLNARKKMMYIIMYSLCFINIIIHMIKIYTSCTSSGLKTAWIYISSAKCLEQK